MFFDVPSLTILLIFINLNWRHFTSGNKMIIHLESENYSPKFSGHETFPMRFGWLKKAHDFVQSSSSPSPFKEESAISSLGVGKNMVSSIQHWAEVTGVLNIDRRDGMKAELSEFGKSFFDDDGLDPFLENPSSLWHLHWRLASRPTCTTWHWTFNYLSLTEFSKEQLVNLLFSLSEERGWKKSKVSTNTLKRDVDCFIQTYCPKQITAKESHEDALSSPLVELGLISNSQKKEVYRLNFGDKPSLSPSVLTFAVMDYWQNVTEQQANTIALENLAYSVSSPGRTFLLDEETLSSNLENVADITDGLISWNEGAGIRQLSRQSKFTDADFNKILLNDYSVN